MTIEELEQYQAEKKECADIKQRMSKLGGRKNIVCDTVRGSMVDYPFTAHTIRIEGISQKSINYRAILHAQYRRKHDAVLAHTVKVEYWLESVRDARVRNIVRYRYMDGMSWREVSRRVYGQRSENRARMALVRYFTNCS